MSSPQTVTEQTDLLAAQDERLVADPAFDAMPSQSADPSGHIEHQQFDESEVDVKRRERQEQRIARIRAALTGDRRAGVYRRHVLRSRLLTDAERSFLCTLTMEFGSQLENCFPSRKYIQQRFGGPKRKLGRLDGIRRSCERKGFLKRWPLTCDEDGALVEAKDDGRFISATGYQFLLPAGIVGDAWDGPRVWSQRLYAQRSNKA